jgi:hypothetical protein
MGENFWLMVLIRLNLHCFAWLCMHCFICPCCSSQWSSASGLWYSKCISPQIVASASKLLQDPNLDPRPVLLWLSRRPYTVWNPVALPFEHIWQKHFNISITHKSTKQFPMYQYSQGLNLMFFKYPETTSYAFCMIQQLLPAWTKAFKPLLNWKVTKLKLLLTSYLAGAQVSKKTIGGVSCWTMSSIQYIKTAIANVESNLEKTGQCLPYR